MRNIFVGSSTEQLTYAKRIAKSLNANGFKALGWWNTGVFPLGDSTLEGLRALSNSCYGAVLLFAKDDRTWYKKKLIESPRANVVMEYGLFVGKLGSRRTVIVKDPKTVLPTNISGITYQPKRRASKEVVEHFLKLPETGNGFISEPSLVTFVNHDTPPALIQGPPEDWVSRNMYLGEKAAQTWARVEVDKKYPGRAGFRELTAAIAEIIPSARKSKITSVVSLGPGVGDLEKEVLPSFQKLNLNFYVPVDINLQLLCAAAKRISKADAKLVIPFGILGDFEEDIEQIGRVVKRNLGPGRLYLMLGGTFVNLEKSEGAFFTGLKSCLDPQDFFLLDVFVKGRNYGDEVELARDIGGLSTPVKNFLSQGYVQRRGGYRSEIAENLKEFVTIRDDVPDSKVDNTVCFSFAMKDTRDPLIYIRRYSEPDLRAYIRNHGFEIVKRRTVLIKRHDVNRALYLLRADVS